MSFASTLPALGRLAALLLASAIGVPAQAADPAGASMPLVVSERFAAAQVADEPTPGALGPAWWRVLAAPQLEELMARLPRGNTALAAAAARLAIARADAGHAAAEGRPRVDVEAGASQARGPLINAAGGSGSLFTTRLGISWAPDLFGRLAANRDASRNDAAAAEADLAAVRLAMEVDLASAWVRYQAATAERELASQAVVLRAEQAAMVSRRHALGFLSGEAEETARRRLAEARLKELHLGTEREDAAAAIAFLLGEAKPIELAPAPLVAIPPIPPGIPAAVLARRADVRAALDRLAAADARVRAARRTLLPGLVLTGSGGAASAGLGALLSAAAQNLTLGVVFGLPLFDGGRHKAEVARRKGERELAEAHLRADVLGALLGVDAALREESEGRAAVAVLESNAAEAGRHLAAVTRQAQVGAASRMAVMEASLANNQARMDLSRLAGARADASLHLIGELGGAW